MRILSAVITVALLVWCLARLQAGIRHVLTERAPQDVARAWRLIRLAGRWLLVRACRLPGAVIGLARRLRGDRTRPWLWPGRAVRVRVASARLRPAPSGPSAHRSARRIVRRAAASAGRVR
jgi:hypothetical protein